MGLHSKSVAPITWKTCCYIWNKPQVVELLSCKPCEVGVNCRFWPCRHILLLLGYCSMRMDAVSADCSREQTVFMSHQICWDRDLIQQSLISSDEHDLGLFTQQLLWNILSLLSIEMMSPVLVTKPYIYHVQRQAISFKGKQNSKTSCTVNFKYVARIVSTFPTIFYVPWQKFTISSHNSHYLSQNVSSVSG